MRFTRCLNQLFDKQETKGVDYSEMQDIFQLIFYTGKPINNFEHYVHVLKKGDFKYGAILEHQKAQEGSEMSKEVNEAIEMHNKYMKSDEVIKGYELERESMIIKTKMNKARKEGIEKSAKKLIQSLYQIDASEWLK